MYFNVLNPERYMPDECDMGTNIYCQDWSLQKHTENRFGLSLKLKNNLQKPIEISNVTLFNKNQQKYYCYSREVFCPSDSTDPIANWTADSPSDFEGSWGVGKSCRVDFVCEGSLIRGDKENYIVWIDFNRKSTDTTPTHTIKGRIFTSS